MDRIIFPEDLDLVKLSYDIATRFRSKESKLLPSTFAISEFEKAGKRFRLHQEEYTNILLFVYAVFLVE